MGLFDIFKPKPREQKPSEQDIIAAEFDAFLDTLQKNGSLNSIQVDAILKKEEFAYLERPVSLHETRSVRYHQNSGRVGFRVMKGVYVASGSTGRSESQQELRHIDDGVLILTNQRFIFNGFKENRVVPLNKIFAIEQFTDGIGISSETRKKSLYFLGINPLIWKAVYEMLTGTGYYGSIVKSS